METFVQLTAIVLVFSMMMLQESLDDRIIYSNLFKVYFYKLKLWEDETFGKGIIPLIMTIELCHKWLCSLDSHSRVSSMWILSLSLSRFCSSWMYFIQLNKTKHELEQQEMSSGSCGTNDCMDGEVLVMAKSNSCTTEGQVSKL